MISLQKSSSEARKTATDIATIISTDAVNLRETQYKNFELKQQAKQTNALL